MSNLTSCPDCNHQVSHSAKKCPNCGRPAPNPSMLIAKVLMVFLGVLIWGGWTSSMLTAPGPLERQFQPLTDSTNRLTETMKRNEALRQRNEENPSP